MQIRLLVLLVLTVLFLGVISACGSGDSAAVPNESADQVNSASSDTSDDEGNSIIVDNGREYSIDDFKAVGYKALTQFELETLPGATDAWFGFFSQKDFELRFYDSHQTALSEGVEPAEIAIGKGGVPWQKRGP